MRIGPLQLGNRPGDLDAFVGVELRAECMMGRRGHRGKEPCDAKCAGEQHPFDHLYSPFLDTNHFPTKCCTSRLFSVQTYCPTSSSGPASSVAFLIVHGFL